MEFKRVSMSCNNCSGVSFGFTCDCTCTNLSFADVDIAKKPTMFLHFLVRAVYMGNFFIVVFIANCKVWANQDIRTQSVPIYITFTIFRLVSVTNISGFLISFKFYVLKHVDIAFLIFSAVCNYSKLCKLSM